MARAKRIAGVMLMVVLVVVGVDASASQCWAHERVCC